MEKQEMFLSFSIVQLLFKSIVNGPQQNENHVCLAFIVLMIFCQYGSK